VSLKEGEALENQALADELIGDLIDENQQLCGILSASIKTEMTIDIDK
jgi:hypothetical protein